MPCLPLLQRQAVADRDFETYTFMGVFLFFILLASGCFQSKNRMVGRGKIAIERRNGNQKTPEVASSFASSC
jgi:hypothetical protein